MENHKMFIAAKASAWACLGLHPLAASDCKILHILKADKGCAPLKEETAEGALGG